MGSPCNLDEEDLCFIALEKKKVREEIAKLDDVGGQGSGKAKRTAGAAGGRSGGVGAGASGGAGAGASSCAAAGASVDAGQQSMDAEATGETEDDDLMEDLYGEVPGPPSPH
eukprot:3221509-Rhodomonas_salina.1